MLAISTSLSFKLLFPVTCLLFAAYIVSNSNYFKNLAFRILIFGLVIFLTVPISVNLMNVVDETLKTQEKIETVAIEEKTDNSAKKENDDKNSGNSFWDNITDKVKNATDKVVNTTKEMPQKLKDKFFEFVDIIASLIITCCIIPLLVIIFLTWILKTLFSINISAKSVYSNIHNNMSKIFIKKNFDNENTDSQQLHQ